MFAWYFSEQSKRLRYGDDRKILTGRTHKVTGELEICKHGLHASQRPIDALRYAPGPILWRVRLGGEIITEVDKACAAERTYLWGFDATDMLREFARKCALEVYPLWGNQQTDPDGVVKRYLETGDETIRAVMWDVAGDAAWDAAWDVAGDAARDAAWISAGPAAWEAAGAAAWNAAGAAAWAASWPAAGAATRAAARAAQNCRLLAMIRKARPSKENQK